VGLSVSCRQINALAQHVLTLHRMITLLGHIPWLAGFLALVPAVAKDFNDMRQACFNRAVARREKGTEQRDLFYYLVLSVHLPPFEFGTDYTPFTVGRTRG